MTYQYTNRELAGYYLSVIGQFKPPTKAQVAIATKIAGAGVNIGEFYEQHRSLRRIPCAVSGSTIKILESLLEKGLDKTKSIGFERNYPAITQKRWPGAGRQQEERECLSFDDAVKVREGD